MVLVKNTACVLLVLLIYAAWLSSARLNPTGAKVYGNSDIKASVATSATNGTTVKILATIEGDSNSHRPSAEQLVRKSSKVKFASSVEDNRSLRSRLSDEFDGGFLAFTADYHRPMHHPPKNNK